MCHGIKRLKKYGEENALQIYRDQKTGTLSCHSKRNRQWPILKITASNIWKLATKHLSAHLAPQTSRRPPGYTFSKCSKEMSQCCLERRAFGLPYNAFDVCIGFDEQITKVRNTRFCLSSTVFWLKRGTNAIRFGFWGQIWNPLVISHLLGPHLIWFSYFDFCPPMLFNAGGGINVFFRKCKFRWAHRDQR